MADAPAVLSNPVGLEIEPQHLGLQKAVYKDVVWTSDGANETAGKTINASDVGLQHIYGVDFLGDVGALHAGTDTVGQLTRTAVDGDSVTVTGLTAAGVALDLDAADIAAARVRIVGD